jgi:hypothetical protein
VVAVQAVQELVLQEVQAMPTAVVVQQHAALQEVQVAVALREVQAMQEEMEDHQLHAALVSQD